MLPISPTLPVSIPDLEEIVALRHHLHQNPELSGLENETSQTLQSFLQRYQPDEIVKELGGTGFAAIFQGKEPKAGPTVLFRAELDALPILEQNEFAYTSIQKGVSHKCGHDGHMATLVGLASILHQQPLTQGQVVLLYQPAEENGAGAWAVLQTPAFQKIAPDYVFALHNLPPLPMGQVLVRSDAFAAASVGLKVQLHGKESHAAEPENGLNPGEGMSELIQAFNALVRDQHHFQDLTLLNVVHARLGDVAFGTNPGFATVMATLRAFEQDDLNKLKSLAIEAVKLVAHKYDLKYDFEWVEEFPATRNSAEATAFVEQAAQDLGMDVIRAAKPVRWSEDFGHFTHRYNGAYFGLGSGPDRPQLHHADYDFPDELIPVGAALFYRIAESILNP
ncbi:amidohydrolase [Pontibacter sp. HSC-36F09]|uniref:amidohydrolase n=1 Tax=Pontibacter sp. HSC-36F09 TaxID=2910966 RepID=UPI00209F113D|nr:amidohydrolase [Pontibacter sp. HSC-36F09]MCP2045780.1 amidohydrolase [Pontibacter sp. HSC-36F09]